MLKIQNVYLSLLYTCKKPNSLKESVKVTPDSICQSLENWYVSCLWLQIFRTAAARAQELPGENVPVGGGKESQERNNAILPQNRTENIYLKVSKLIWGCRFLKVKMGQARAKYVRVSSVSKRCQVWWQYLILNTYDILDWITEVKSEVTFPTEIVMHWWCMWCDVVVGIIVLCWLRPCGVGPGHSS